MDMNVLTTSLTHLVGVLSHGQEAVQKLQGNLLRGLAIIEIALAACWVALDASSLSSMFKKLLTLCFWIFFAKEFSAIAHQFCESLVTIGLGAGGSGGTFSILLDPSSIAGRGLDVTAPLVKLLDTLGVTQFKETLMFTMSYFFIMACYMAMALQVFLAVIEFYLIVTLAGALIPFGISGHTKFLAEKAIGAAVAASIKLMVLAFMLSVIGPTLSSLKFAGDEISLNELMAVMLNSAALAFLVWTAPSLAAGLLAGSPTLSAAGITQSVATGARMATGAAAGMIGGASAATRAFRDATGESKTPPSDASSGDARGLGATPTVGASTPASGGFTPQQSTPPSWAAAVDVPPPAADA